MYSYDSLRFQRRPEQVLATQEYYYRATHFTTSHAFATKRDRVIWEMHADGKPVLEIAKKTKVDHNKVWKIICDLRGLMLGHKKV